MKLIIEDDDGRKTVVPFAREEISIGRRDGNTIRLTERNVSRRHARLTRANGHVFIEDLGSYNGIKVNGGKVQGRAEVQEGDLIEIGDYNLAIQLETAEVLHGVSASEPPRSPPVEEAAKARQSSKTTPEHLVLTRPLAPAPAEHADQPQVGGPVTKESSYGAREGRPSSENSGRAVPFPGEGLAPALAQTSAPSHLPNILPSSETAAPPPLGKRPLARADATAVIRVDLDALNKGDQRAPLPPGQRPRLVVVSGEHSGRSFELDHTSTTVGRTEDNDVAIEHRSLSRQHCRIFLDQDDKWKVVDRASANGVRVNGDAYGLIDLRRGDIIELGHVRIRFCDPGDPFVYADEPAPSTVKLETGLKPSQGTRRLAPTLVAAGVIGALTVVALALVNSGIFGSDSGSELPGKARMNEAGVREAIQRAGDAAEREQWAQAREAYNQAIELDPDNSAAVEGLKHVEAESAAHARFEDVMEAVSAAAWERAWENLDAIPSDSIYAERLAEYRTEILAGRVVDLMETARVALTSSLFEEASRIADEALALSPEHGDALEIKARAERGIAREEKAREAAIAAEERRQQTALARQQRRQQQQQQQPTTKRSQKAAPAAQEQASESLSEAQKAYELGIALVSRREWREAIHYLEQALRLDPRGHSEAHAYLGTCYANVGNLQLGAMHYRRFLETNPNHPQAPTIRGILQDYERTAEQ